MTRAPRLITTLPSGPIGELALGGIGPPGRDATRRAPAGTRHPSWLRVADACQRSMRQPVPVLTDVAVATAVVSAVTSGPAAVVAALALLGAGLLFGVWKRRTPVQAQGVGWYLRRTAPAAVVAGAAVYFYPGTSDGATLVSALGILVVLGLLKAALTLLVGGARRRGLGLTRALVVGPERHVAGVEYRIHLNPEAGLVCAHSHVVGGHPDRTPADNLALVTRLLDDHAIDHVVVCTGGDDGPDTLVRDIVRIASPTVDMTVVSPVRLAGTEATRLGDLAFTGLARPSWGTDAGKRVIDVLGAIALTVVCLPLMLVTAAAIRLGDPGPAVFCQRRTGRQNRMFTIFKFRSMVDDAERLKIDLLDRNVADGLLFKAENDPRITRVGAVIRRFSVDELPQLLNVIRGQMSLVGPRPLPIVFDRSDLFAQVRHTVRPGITGLWQVKGANALSYEDMIDLDCAYVATRSLGFDLKILLQTLPAVMVRRDPY
ncbi:MAG TPA: sugar transferase [Acidimicrobiales bacterium]|nr:sugar transferase [Acidimicrobiales bacterium]